MKDRQTVATAVDNDGTSASHKLPRQNFLQNSGLELDRDLFAVPLGMLDGLFMIATFEG